MVSENIIRKRLERLEVSLKRLESKKGISEEEFLKNWEVQDVVLRELQIAIEACIDISTHIISEKGWETPERYRDVVEILERHRVIPKNYKEKLSKMIAFRNIIVHEYLQVDLKTVYRILHQLDDFREFANHIENFLKKEKNTK